MRYVYEIWCWLSEYSDINQQETESSIEPPRPPSWKIDMTSYLRIGCSDMDEIWQIYAEYHAYYGNMVEIETGSKIPIMADVCFSQTAVTILAVNWTMSTKFDRRILKTTTSTNTKPEVVSSRGGDHVKNRYDVITPPQMARFGWNLADWCRITCQLRRCGRGGSRKKNFNMADVFFLQTGNSCVKSRMLFVCIQERAFWPTLNNCIIY